MSRKSVKSKLHDVLVVAPWWGLLMLPLGVWSAIKWGIPAMTKNKLLLSVVPMANVWGLIVGAVCLAALTASFERRALLRSASTLETLRALDWRDFEKLVAQAYRQQGWRVSENWGRGADGGVDLDLRKGTERLVVQCKQWRTRQVPVTRVRELWGIVASEQATGAVFVTSGGYTQEAITFARGKRLELVDGEKLLKLVGGVDVPQDTEVPVSRGDIEAAPSVQMQTSDSETATPACPSCGGPMVVRTARKGANAGSSFWGCPRYPSCKGVREKA